MLFKLYEDLVTGLILFLEEDLAEKEGNKPNCISEEMRSPACKQKANAIYHYTPDTTAVYIKNVR